MVLKNELLALAGTYEELKKEAISAVNAVKVKASDLTDVQRVQYLVEQKDFNLKNNILAVFDLAERYNVNAAKLKQLQKRYLDTEKNVMNQSVMLGELGLKNISVGPKAMGALCGSNAVYIYINNLTKSIDVKVYPLGEDNEWTGDFERTAWKLKKDVEKVLDGKEIE